jgi:hypothetical protein
MGYGFHAPNDHRKKDVGFSGDSSRFDCARLSVNGPSLMPIVALSSSMRRPD